MSETIDKQARDDLYKEMIRAKEAEANLGFLLESLQKQVEELKKKIDLKIDDAPTRDSDSLITSGAVYDGLMSLNKKIDALR